MRKLVFVIVGLFALFTLIKAYTSVRAEEDGTTTHQIPIATQPNTPVSH